MILFFTEASPSPPLPRPPPPLPSSPHVTRFPVNKVSEREVPRKLSPLGAVGLTDAWARDASIKRVLMSTPAPPNAVLTHDKHNLLARAVHTAFYNHCPLVLTPDVVWITVMQGLSRHTAKDPEAQRAAWGVTFQNKMDILVGRNEDYMDDSPGHDWAGVITEFSDKIAVEIGADKLALAECAFSTSTPVDRIVSRVVLLEGVQSYFNLMMCCGCGIPWIELRGAAAEWAELRARAARLRTFTDLGWWCDELEPVLDQFASAAAGKVDALFWGSVCNLHGASGISEPMSGWIQALFPYLNDYERDVVGANVSRNQYLGGWRKEYDSGKVGDLSTGFGSGRGRGPGVSLKSIPSGLSSAPFTMERLTTHTQHSMAFIGGLACITQDPASGALQVHTGYAVVEKNPVDENGRPIPEAGGRDRRQFSGFDDDY